MTYSMKWDGFSGRVRGIRTEASCEMMDLHQPNWHCRFYIRFDDEALIEAKYFEEGELEQAHEWCTQKVKEHDERTRDTATTT